MKISILDSGYDNKNNNVKAFLIKQNGDNYILGENYIDESSHGTAVTNLLLSHLPTVSITMYKVFDESLTCNIEKILSALEYIFLYDDCDIIHLSLGTKIDDTRLYNVCNRLHKKGVIIVSAFENSGGISFPAAYDFVFGVDVSSRIVKTNEYIYVKDSIVNLLCFKGNVRTISNENKVSINQGTSFSSIFATIILVNLIDKNKPISFKKLNEMLEADAKYVSVAEKSDVLEDNNPLLPFSDAYVVPYNKETASILLFSDAVTMKIQGFFDIRQSSNVGRKICNLKKTDEYTINDITKINEYDFSNNTGLIIGHFDVINNILGYNLKYRILEMCYKKRIPVFMFDIDGKEIFEDKFKKANIPFSYPQINKSFGLKDRFGMLYTHKKPIVGIFGTGTKQGKFSLQIKLKQMFLNEGYNISSLGTEPQSYLFGFDEVYPYGYSSVIKMEDMQKIQYLNQVMHTLDQKNDITMVGAQSGTVPKLTDNLGQLQFETNIFLLGTSADGVILCVNPSDKISYIQRTINYIENLTGKTKVFALCLFPFDMNSGWQIANSHKVIIEDEKIIEVRNEMSNQIDLPVYINGNNNDMMNLFKTTIEFFS